MRFCSLSKDFEGSAQSKILVFFRVFLAFLAKKQGLEGQGFYCVMEGCGIIAESLRKLRGN